ncbi:MAG: serine/threonine-protein kinase [Rubripirellula sp.]
MKSEHRCGTLDAVGCLLNQLTDGVSAGKSACRICNKTERDLDRELKSLGRLFLEDTESISPGERASIETTEQLAIAAGERAKEASSSVKQAEESKRSQGISRFPVDRKLYETDLASVYVAKDRELPRDVALHELLPQHAYSTTNHVRFLREAKIAGMLEHPGVLPIYSVGRHQDGRPYYVTRLVIGVPLSGAIERLHSPAESGNADRSLRRLLRCFVDVCRTADYAHSQDVIHHNIHPDNILLGTRGETLLQLWGQASFHSDDEPEPSSRAPNSLAQLSGKPEFASPERAFLPLAAMTRQSDVFSLGATLCSVLTGKPPYESTDPQVFQQIREGAIRWEPSDRIKVPRRLEAICRRALEKNLEIRYATAEDLASDLENWLAGLPVSLESDSLLRGLLRRFLS